MSVLERFIGISLVSSTDIYREDTRSLFSKICFKIAGRYG